MKNHHFAHLDGAVRIYRKESYDKRLATDLPPLPEVITTLNGSK